MDSRGFSPFQQLVPTVDIVGVHGFNVRDRGKGTVHALGHRLLDVVPNSTYDADGGTYGFHWFFRVRFFNKKAVRQIADVLAVRDVVFAHSNGANYVMKALKLLKEEGRENPNLHIIFISPALNRKQKLEQFQFKRLDVLCSKADWVVWVSKLLRFHPWGSAGQKGIISDDPRLFNHQFERISHSGWFTDLALIELTNFVGNLINKTVGKTHEEIVIY